MTTNCPCQMCGVNIEFDAEQNGLFVNCPSCAQQTRLIIPASKRGIPLKREEPNTDGDSGIAACLIVFAILNFIGAILGLVIAGANEEVALGVGFCAGGVLGGLVLLGFAAIIEHTKASAERLRRIEIILAKK